MYVQREQQMDNIFLKHSEYNIRMRARAAAAREKTRRAFKWIMNHIHMCGFARTWYVSFSLFLAYTQPCARSLHIYLYISIPSEALIFPIAKAQLRRTSRSIGDEKKMQLLLIGLIDLSFCAYRNLCTHYRPTNSLVFL